VAGANRCEENKSYFDYIHNQAGDESLIIIARLGDGERGRAFNWRRLHNIREYLTYIRAIPERNVLVAEGEPVKGRGRVEVYLRGRLLALFIVGPNHDLNGGDCEDGRSTRYYPWRKKSPFPAARVPLDDPS
jgi:hypothetical protein